MALDEELVDRLKKVDESRKDVVSIKDWWETNHKEDEPFLLSGTPGRDVWKSLDILDEVYAGKNILNIGIGLGYCTKELHNIGVNVHVLDISTVALKRVEKFVNGAWLPEQLPDIPKDYFDLAISHLVAQHMSDEDLLHQIKYVVKSLKPGGFFAIQIAYSKQKEYKFIEGFDTQKWGGVFRSLKKINELVKKADGRIAWVDNIGDFPEFEVSWYGVHIVKNNDNSFNQYHLNKLNKKTAKLTEIEAEYFLTAGNAEKAQDLYKEALGFNKDSINALKKSGLLAYEKDEKENAHNFIDIAYKLDKRDIETILMLGNLYLESGDILKAYNLLFEYKNMYPVCSEINNLKFIPFIADSLNALGDIYLAAGLYTESKKIYELLVKNIPGESDLIQKIDYSESQKDIEESGIDLPTQKLRLAEMAIEKQLFTEAKIFLNDILSGNSKNVSALIDLGVVYAMEDNISEAEKCFKNVLEIEPGNEIATENLGAIKP